MTEFERLAELLLPQIDKKPEYYESLYPERNLPEGARVVRVAPSPTGYLHLGTLFAALVNRITATSTGGVFFTRIEDTDKKREIEGGIENIIDGLNRFGITIDEGFFSGTNEKGDYGPYQQSHRAEIYQTYAKKLIIEGLAYPCFCTAEELEAVRGEQEALKVRTGYHGKWAKHRDISYDEAKALIEDDTLLIIVDTHIRSLLESQEIYSMCRNVVVIDHHRRMVGSIDNAVIFYHEPYASSASEMVTELLQYFDSRCKIKKAEAEALLSGIMLDTKSFSMRAGVRTFEAAAYLKKMGADTVGVKELFSGSLQSYQHRSKIVSMAEIYRGCAVSFAKSYDDIGVVAPQAADELLNIRGVSASVVMYKTAVGVSFSARSLGGMNVQVIMEALGGGGHQTMAGAQIPDITPGEAKERLLAAIDDYYEKAAGHADQ